MTLYPQNVDGYGSLPVLRDAVDPIRANDINRIRAAAIAIEEELGINPSSTYATVRARLDALEELLLALYVFDQPGDLITWDGTDPARLAAGPDGYVLMADSTKELGLRWTEIDLSPDGYGTVGGSGTAGRVAVWSNGTDITGDADLTFDGTNLAVTGQVRTTAGIRFGDLTTLTTAPSFADRALSNLSTTTVNTGLMPAIHDGYDVGSDAVRWQDGYYVALHTTNGVRYGDGTIQTTAAVAGGITSVSGAAPIASSGGATPTISLNDTAVTPGSYTLASITVDQKGRLTSASSGSVSFAGHADQALSNLTATTVNTSLLPATHDGYDLGSAARRWQDIFSTTAVISNYIEVAEVAAPSTPDPGFGRIYEKTNGKLYFLNDAGAEYDLTEVGVGGGGGDGADRNLSNLLPTTVNLSLIPATDDGYDLGSSLLRWRDIYLGPSSVRFVTTIGETGTARDWRLGVVETAGASQGSFKILEGATQTLAITPGGQLTPNAGTAAAPPYAILGSLGTGIYSPAANQLGFATSGTSRATIDDSRWTFSHPLRTSSYFELAEAAAPSSPGTGFGRLYLDSATSPSKLIFKDEAGTAFDLTAVGGGTPSGPAGGDLTGTYPNPTLSTTVVSSFARTFLDDTSASAVRATIGAGTGNGTVTSVSGDGSTISSTGGATPVVSVVAGGINTTQLANNGVTRGKLQSMSSTSMILGSNDSSFAVTELTLQALDVSGSTLRRGALTGDVTASAGSSVTAIGAGKVLTAMIATGAVTEDKLSFSGGSTSKDATTTAHGLLPTLSGSGAQYLSGLGTWTTPAAAGSAGGDLTGTYPNPTIGNLKVTTAKIANLAVTEDKLAAAAVVTDKIKDGNVTTAKFPDSTSSTTGITLPKIQQIAGGIVLGRYQAGLGHIQALGPANGIEVETATGNLQIAVGGVSTTRIADGAVTTSKLGTGAVTTAILGTASVTEIKLSFTPGDTSKNFNTTTHGLVPISPGGTTRFLRADGTWAVP